MAESLVFNMDCIKGMMQYPDNFFDLAIVDPPYGSDKIERTGGSWSRKYDRCNKIKDWDFVPKKDYFDELFRVSKNQIIWGGNYFNLPPNRHFLIWKKHIPENFTLSMCEYAWSSFNANAKFIEIPSNREHLRIHPTQKPIKLYEWILLNYANKGDKILDTHLGSGSSRIAADKLNFDFYGFELDKEYFEKSIKRFENYKIQLKLF